MSSFKIPHGRTYTFAITVLERNSFLPQNLALMDLANSSFSLVKLDTLVPVSGTITISKISDPNGLISVTIPSTVTSTMTYERGSKVDGYYVKPTYQGVITIKFTDATSDITAVVPEICVIPTGA